MEGEFVKEEYSDHMKVNKRYYKWISSENPNHFIYVNFDEDESGVYTVSGEGNGSRSKRGGSLRLLGKGGTP